MCKIEIGNAHETGDNVLDDISNPYEHKFKTLKEADTAVDYLNIIAGHEIGNSSSTELSMNEMTGLVIDYYYQNGLNVVKENSDGTYSVVKETIAKELYDSSKETLDTLDENGFPPGNKYYNKK